MQIINPLNYAKQPSFNFYGSNLLGVVVKTEDEFDDGRIGVSIPKLSMGIDLKKAEEKDISIELEILNDDGDNFFEKTVTSSNYVILDTMTISNIDKPFYQKGENILIGLIDCDIKSIGILPYVINGQESSRGKNGDSMKIFVPALSPTDQPNTIITKENSYFMEFDSRDRKLISIGTSNKNGEPYPLNFTMDAKNGVISMSSDSKLVFSYNPNEDKMLFYTDGEAAIEVKEDTATIIAKKILIQGESEVKIETKNFILNADKIETTAKVGEYDIKQYSQTSSNIEFKSTTTLIDGMNLNIKSTIGIQADSTVSVFNGVLGAVGLTMGAMPSSPSLMPPVTSNTMDVPVGKMEIGSGSVIVKSGNLKINGGVPLVKAPSAKNLLQIVGSLIDMAAASPTGGNVGATTIVGSMLNSLDTSSLTAL